MLGKSYRSDEVEAFTLKNASFEGKMTFEEPVRLNGKFDGEIISKDVLIIGEAAVINAEIEAGTLIVEGEVNGNVSANVKIEILSTGKLYGNIDTPALVIEAGGFFEGNCNMAKATGRVAAEKVTPIKEQEVELFQDEDQQDHTDHPQMQT
jgi:cytoskeletal protein CcmA (bactofilin family)